MCTTSLGGRTTGCQTAGLPPFSPNHERPRPAETWLVLPFAKPLRARTGGRFLLLPPSERRTSSTAPWTLTASDSPGTFFQKFTPPISANLSRHDGPAARLQESFQLCVRNMGTFCLNGNTTELRLPAMHYSASRPLSQADRKQSQMERFEDADRQGGRYEVQTIFTSGHPEATSQQSKEKSVKVQRRFRKFYQRLDGDTTFLAAAFRQHFSPFLFIPG